ncbi:hypothetical protein XAC3810_520045 [Xanthomonas citri pv. citri]|uniref:Uncharacterized protein n=1 Tax=Xanthomonas citri pv. citri TaxID=611301 RepID=A0A0U5BUV8_XANCI|nr:hypothetical protein XAC9322_520138 [Xanthomonas citri pv. citri]CEE30869.1 hypothetical protein XAC3824_660139 [Xanthomonas citri pv. citri]CEE32215.1 hypothetical protein XAC1083_510139 [Xanthomonas citri pv. citri]CEE41687.1 hypothetical protein XAC3810_520045 [Xanthomonas citri pv. citri]CEE43689.1 hypothetical protein XAC902_680140 [Xanthomonas citri pv. citri]
MVADCAGGKVQFFGGVGEILVAGGSGEHAQRGQQGRAQIHRGMSEICGSPRYYALVAPTVATDAGSSPRDDRAMSLSLPAAVFRRFIPAWRGSGARS